MANYNWYIQIFLLFSGIVKGDDENGCLVYDFESDLEVLEYDASVCGSFPLWTVGNYTEIGIESPNPVSESFISPTLSLSCISSLTFRASGGVVEINVYMDGRSPLDILQALLMMTSGTNDMAVATATLSPSLADLNGWHILKLEVPDDFGDFEGYIALLGSKSEESIFLVDSFRFIPNTMDDKTCVIYENETETTPDSFETTTQKPNDVNSDHCVTYNFETDFDVLFTSDNYFCDGFLPWNLVNYTSANVESPDTKSSLFISPSEELSCISSFIFTMEPNSVIEAHVYIEPTSKLDHIIVIAKKVSSQVDTVAGFRMYYPENQQFVTGWNVLTFSIVDFNSFDGYLLFFGRAAEGSTVLLDSMRYIPPSTSDTDISCSLY